ncbi:hypothetical protein EJB05_36971, partial [Eragrostis curvula]
MLFPCRRYVIVQQIRSPCPYYEHDDAMPINELITENGKSGGMQGFVWQVGFEVYVHQRSLLCKWGPFYHDRHFSYKNLLVCYSKRW